MSVSFDVVTTVVPMEISTPSEAWPHTFGTEKNIAQQIAVRKNRIFLIMFEFWLINRVN